MSGRGAALLGLLAVVGGPALAGSDPGPEAAPPVRLLMGTDWRQGESLGVWRPEVFLDLSRRPFEGLELRVRAAVALGLWLAPVDGTVDAIARWTPAGWAKEEGVWVQVSPLGSTRLQLGFDPLLRMGALVPGQISPVAAAVGLEREAWSARIAVKSVALQDQASLTFPRFHSMFVQGAWSSPRSWKIAVAGAYITTGIFPLPPSQGPLRPTSALGGAARVIYRSAGEIGAPLDLDRVQRAPWGDEAIFAPAPPRQASGVEVVVEGILGEERLNDPDQPQFPVLVQRVLYGAQASVRWAAGESRYQVGAAWRSPSLVIADQFGLPQFTAFSPAFLTYDDIWVDGSWDWAPPGRSFVPGVHLRLRRPGGVTPESIVPRTVLLDPVAILPDGAAPPLGWSALLTGAWAPAPFVGVFLQAGLDYDPNRVVTTGPIIIPEPAPPYALRLNAAAQLAF